MSSKNKFSSALRHLNSNLDEKVRKLEEQPTNNTGTLYTLVPPNPDASPNVFTPEYQTKTTAPLDLSVGSDPTSSAEAEDTSGLFDAEGLPMTATPPGDTSYILGPMSTMYYAWASRTQIGYIRESDRRMVNLGYITGNFGGWDGNEAAFNSYGQLTLEQAQWYRTIGKKDGADNSTENYRAFYPGPPSSVADAYGRYLCTITGEPKETTTDHPQSNSGSAQGPGDASDNFSAQMYNSSMNAKQFWNKLLDRIRQVGFDNLTDMEKEFYDLYSDTDDGQDAADEFIQNLGNEANKPEYANFWQKMGKAGEVFGKFLFNALPDVIDNDTLGDSYINSIVKKMTINDDGTLNFGDNILGTTQVPYVNSAGQLVVDYNYNFKDNADELGGKQDQLTWMQKTFGPIVYGYLGKYSADASPKTGDPTGLVDMMLGSVFSKAIEASKAFGGAQDKKGQLILDIDQLPTRIQKELGLGEYGDPSDTGTNTNPSGFNTQASSQGTTVNWGGGMGSAVIVAGNYGALKNWEKSILQNGLKVRSGSSYDNELKRLKKMYPGFAPQAQSIPINNTQVAHYKPQGLNLSESKSRIMKTLKEPVVLPEGKKKSYKVRPGRRGKTDFKGMDKLIGDTKIEKTFKEPQDIWNKDWHGYNQRKSQDKKNIVLELVGQSTDAYNYMLTDSKKMNAKKMEEFWGLHPEMYSQFHNGKKYKTVRKEQLKGDRLVFLVDEKGVKTSILQSKLNDQLAQKHEQELLDEYNKLNPPKEEPVKKKPLLKKVADRLNPDVAPVHPKDPPPKMVNGMHPKYGKNYKYDKLDSVSAVMMSRAPTGDPEIDANVRKAAKKPK